MQQILTLWILTKNNLMLLLTLRRFLARFIRMWRKHHVMALSKLKIRKVKAWTRVKKRRLIVKFLDQNNKKSRWKMKKPWLALDVMELRLTEEDFLAEDVMEQEVCKILSTENYQRCLRKKFKVTLLKLSRDWWEII